MCILAGVLLFFSWVLGLDLGIKFCVSLFTITAYPEGAFMGCGHVFAAAIAAEWGARVTRTFLAGLTISVMLPEVVSTTAASAN
jgi:hypothetical protein